MVHFVGLTRLLVFRESDVHVNKANACEVNLVWQSQPRLA